jgi:uncharacterized protein (TIGR00730 family)
MAKKLSNTFHDAYRRADQDVEFLQRPEARGIRLELEYLKPEMALQESGIQGTIVMFGSARTLPPERARDELDRAREDLKLAPDDADLAAQVARAERRLDQSRYYGVARELAQIVGRGAGGPDDGRLVTVTGGGPGIMEAANRGADDVGAPSIGLNITLPHEQEPNPYITPELCFQFRYFALRKLHFLKRAKALIAFPGGFGTFDELFETLCLVQTRKVEPLPIVLVGKKFWQRAVNFEHLADEGVISPKDVDLFSFAETAEEAWEQVQAWYVANDRPLV